MADKNISDRELYILELEAKVSKLEEEIDAIQSQQHEQFVNKEFYQAVFNNSLDGIILNYPDGTILNANPAACRMFGKTKEELCAAGRNGVVDLTDPRVMDAVKSREMNGFFCSQMTLLRNDSTKFTGEVTSNLFRDKNGQILSSMVVRDLTDFQKSEEIFNRAFHDNQTMMAISRVNDGVYIDVNNSFAENLGYTREQLLGKSLLDLGLWIDLKDRQLLYDHLSQFGSAKNMEYKLRGAKNIFIDVIASGNLLDFNGEKCLITSLINITERKKAEAELNSAKDKFFKVFNDNQAMMAIVTLDEGKFVDVNDTALRIMGYSKEEILGFSLLDIGLWVDINQREAMLDLLDKHGFIENYECSLRHQSGQDISFMCSINLILIDDIQCMIVSGIDITAFKEYQKELLRLDNLNIMGQMAASIAHEVRNPMTSIKGFLQLFKSQYKYQEDHAAMELMIEELDRMNDIISNFLSLAHKNKIDIRLHSLNDSITNVLPLIMADALKNDIYLETTLGNLPMIMIDESEIRQLLLNLARNSIQAMSSGGTLTVKTFEDINGANLIVQDNGTGIAPEVIGKIGTPFFTTKSDGSGLGLGVCYSIAESHNARITFDTSNEGTCFKVTFPAVI